MGGGQQPPPAPRQNASFLDDWLSKRGQPMTPPPASPFGQPNQPQQPPMQPSAQLAPVDAGKPRENLAPVNLEINQQADKSVKIMKQHEPGKHQPGKEVDGEQVMSLTNELQASLGLSDKPANQPPKHEEPADTIYIDKDGSFQRKDDSQPTTA